MRIDTHDDSDKTREFIWKKSSNLAFLVSQKLSNAAKSMLNPVDDVAQNQTSIH